MPQLLRIDSSFQGDASVSRALTDHATRRWRETHVSGTVTERDLGAQPVPHFDAATGLARMVAPGEHSDAQAGSWALTQALVGEILAADTVVIGMPLYNFGPPSSLKAWVDHLVAPGLSVDPATMTGLLGGRDVIVLASRGGGYGPGTPREGWDHAQQWLTHALSTVGLTPRVITAELTLANVNPHMADLRDLAAQSLRAAHAEIEELWAAPVAVG
jgi:FMN-dependent NADH-azoreductase